MRNLCLLHESVAGSFLLAALVAMVFGCLASAEEVKPPSPHVSEAAAGQQATVPSSDDDFEIVDVKGWKLHLHKDYVHGDQDVLAGALKNAEIQLGHIETLLPEKAVERLREVPIWINPGRRKAEYHWQRQWLIDHGRNPDMARCVQITDIAVLQRTRPSGPWVLMHEMMHAYHDRVVSDEDKRAIHQAYHDALDKGLYESVLHSGRARSTRTRAYAATRMEEYFAENCEAYFGLNDFYPFVRPELRDYDPAIYEIIERVFGIGD